MLLLLVTHWSMRFKMKLSFVYNQFIEYLQKLLCQHCSSRPYRIKYQRCRRTVLFQQLGTSRTSNHTETAGPRYLITTQKYSLSRKKGCRFILSVYGRKEQERADKSRKEIATWMNFDWFLGCSSRFIPIDQEVGLVRYFKWCEYIHCVWRVNKGIIQYVPRKDYLIKWRVCVCVCVPQKKSMVVDNIKAVIYWWARFAHQTNFEKDRALTTCNRTWHHDALWTVNDYVRAFVCQLLNSTIAIAGVSLLFGTGGWFLSLKY